MVNNVGNKANTASWIAHKIISKSNKAFEAAQPLQGLSNIFLLSVYITTLHKKIKKLLIKYL